MRFSNRIFLALGVCLAVACAGDIEPTSPDDGSAGKTFATLTDIDTGSALVAFNNKADETDPRFRGPIDCGGVIEGSFSNGQRYHY